MIAKRFRLPARQIKKVFRFGQRNNGEFFQIYRLLRSGRSRFAFIVSTKVAKSAVTRNRLKRLAKATVLDNFPQTSADYVIVVRKSFVENKEATAQLKECLSKKP